MAQFAVIVEFVLHEGAAEVFVPLVTGNARASLDGEPGCLRFDVLAPAGDAGRVLLYEIYESRAAFDAHLATRHFRDFDRAVAHLVAEKTVASFDLVAA